MQKMINGNKSDHDLLILVDQKVDRLSYDIKSLDDGLTSRVNIIENRLTKIDITMTESDAPVRIKQHDEMYQWMRQVKFTYKVIVTLLSLITFVIGFIMANIVKVLQINQIK